MNGGGFMNIDEFTDNMPPPFLGLEKSASASQFLAGPGQGMSLNKNNSFFGGFNNSAFSLNRESSAFKMNVKDEKPSSSMVSPDLPTSNGLKKVEASSERNHSKRK